MKRWTFSRYFRSNDSTDLCPEWSVWIHQQKAIFLLGENTKTCLTSNSIDISQLLNILNQLHEIPNHDLQMTQGQLGDPKKTKILGQLIILHLKKRMPWTYTLWWNLNGKDIPEVHGVREVQEIPKFKKKVHSGWNYSSSVMFSEWYMLLQQKRSWSDIPAVLGIPVQRENKKHF